MQEYINQNPINPVEAIKDNFNYFSLRFEHFINGYADVLRDNANQQRFEAAKSKVSPAVVNQNKLIIPTISETTSPIANNIKTRVEKYKSFSNDLAYNLHQVKTNAKDSVTNLVTYARVDTLEFIRKSLIVVAVTFVAVTYGLSLLNLAKPIPLMPRF